MNTGWHLIDVYWFLFKPPHKEKLLLVLHCNIVVFLSCRLQEQEQALNLSIKEATAKVSPVSSDLIPSAAAQLPLCMKTPRVAGLVRRLAACQREVGLLNVGICIHVRVFCVQNSNNISAVWIPVMIFKRKNPPKTAREEFWEPSNQRSFYFYRPRPVRVCVCVCLPCKTYACVFYVCATRWHERLCVLHFDAPCFGSSPVASPLMDLCKLEKRNL